MASNFSFYFVFVVVIIVILLWILIRICKNASNNEVYPTFVNRELTTEEANAIAEEILRDSYFVLDRTQGDLEQVSPFEYPFVSLTTREPNDNVPPPIYTEVTAHNDVSITIPNNSNNPPTYTEATTRDNALIVEPSTENNECLPSSIREEDVILK